MNQRSTPPTLAIVLGAIFLTACNDGPTGETSVATPDHHQETIQRYCDEAEVMIRDLDTIEATLRFVRDHRKPEDHKLISGSPYPVHKGCIALYESGFARRSLRSRKPISFQNLAQELQGPAFWIDKHAEDHFAIEGYCIEPRFVNGVIQDERCYPRTTRLGYAALKKAAALYATIGAKTTWSCDQASRAVTVEPALAAIAELRQLGLIEPIRAYCAGHAANTSIHDALSGVLVSDRSAGAVVEGQDKGPNTAAASPNSAPPAASQARVAGG